MCVLPLSQNYINCMLLYHQMSMDRTAECEESKDFLGGREVAGAFTYCQPQAALSHSITVAPCPRALFKLGRRRAGLLCCNTPTDLGHSETVFSLNLHTLTSWFQLCKIVKTACGESSAKCFLF